MASIGLGIAQLAGGLTSGILGSNAASKAASQEVAAAQQALDFQKEVYGTQQQNQAPFVQAGQTSIAQLMKDIQNGQFGPGSLGSVPTAPGAFTAPTLAQAQNYPGYQFNLQQGEKAIQQQATTQGGISGGTLKSLNQFATNTANNTYGTLFSQALQGYNANLSQYASQLAGYQTELQGQQQAYNQLLAPAQLGEGATQSINNTGTQVASNVGNLLTQQGNAAAAGTVGSTNAITGAINNTIGGVSQSVLLGQLMKALNNNSTFNPNPAGVNVLSDEQYNALPSGSPSAGNVSYGMPTFDPSTGTYKIGATS